MILNLMLRNFKVATKSLHDHHGSVSIYAFYTVARNETGNREDAPETPDVTTHINESVVMPTPTPEATSSGLFQS